MAATEKLQAGDVVGAAADLVRLAEEQPESAVAADALFTAARIYEEQLDDPVRALELYQRIGDRYPESRVAVAAGRRAEPLRREVGPTGEGAERAAVLARVMRQGATDAATLAEAQALADADWPGAVRAATWLADVAKRTGRLREAIARYRAIAARWPGTPEAKSALRSAAATALAERDFALAGELARALPAERAVDRIARDEILDEVARGLALARWRAVGWIVLVATALALLGLWLRTGWGELRWAPPLEVKFLLPVALALWLLSRSTRGGVELAVAELLAGGGALLWLWSAGLDAARARDVASARRIAVATSLCVAGALAVVFLTLTQPGLAELIGETLRYGPDH